MLHRPGIERTILNCARRGSLHACPARIKIVTVSRQAVIFDGDDTLWRTEILYDQARDAARQIVSNSGLNASQWETRQRAIDIANVAVYGFSSERFPASCLQALDEIEIASDGSADRRMRERIARAATSVFRKNPKLVPYATSVLQKLRKRGVRLALLTKGDPIVQKQRIERSGLAPLFDVIEIVPEKTPAVIRNVLDKLDARPCDSWTIGNSLRSDILPAVEVGVRGIWIDAPVWEYERTATKIPSTSVHKASDIRAVLALIQ